MGPSQNGAFFKCLAACLLKLDIGIGKTTLFGFAINNCICGQKQS